MRGLIIPVVALACAVSGPAWCVDEAKGSSCLKTGQACLDRCDTQFEADSGALLGCRTRCNADAMQCQAQTAIDENLPKIRQETERWKGFMEDFMNGFMGDDPVPMPTMPQRQAPQSTPDRTDI